MIRLDLPPGAIMTVDHDQLATTDIAGWRLVAVIEYDSVTSVFDQEQPRHSHKDSYGISPLVTVMRSIAVRKTHYVFHMAQEEVDIRQAFQGELDNARKEVAEVKASMEVAVAKAQALAAQVTDLERAEKQWGERDGRLRSELEETRGLVRKLEDEIVRHKTDLAAQDWRLIIKAIGVERVREIVGRDIPDPDPATPEQVPSAYDRLLEDE